MRRIVHLSDLHFGSIDATVVEPLLAAVAAAEPHLVAISGDLTQRATRAQYEEAAVFLRRIPFPTLVVPGNHDISLHNLLRRFVRPLDRFHRHVSAETEPVYEDEELLAIGVNTARSLAWKGGRISPAQIARLADRLAAAPSGKMRVVVSHHPFLPPAGSGWRAAAGRARTALEALERRGADVLLAGHLHVASTRLAEAVHPAARRSILVIQAGTATSTRVRRELNSFNLIEADPVAGEVTVESRRWDPSSGSFGPGQSVRYVGRGAWRALDEP